jgi:hypothetical protein
MSPVVEVLSVDVVGPDPPTPPLPPPVVSVLVVLPPDPPADVTEPELLSAPAAPVVVLVTPLVESVVEAEALTDVAILLLSLVTEAPPLAVAVAALTVAMVSEDGSTAVSPVPPAPPVPLRLPAPASLVDENSTLPVVSLSSP